MVCSVAVCVLWHMQKDEEVLSEVVGHSRKAGETVVRKAEHHHFSGRRTCWLDELKKQYEVEKICEVIFNSTTAFP